MAVLTFQVKYVRTWQILDILRKPACTERFDPTRHKTHREVNNETVWYNKTVNKLIKALNKKPYLSWYLKKKESPSDKSIFEHILNYGSWDDYLMAEKTFGIQKTKTLFNALKTNLRVNLRNRTINYFEKYYQKYA